MVWKQCSNHITSISLVLKKGSVTWCKTSTSPSIPRIVFLKKQIWFNSYIQIEKFAKRMPTSLLAINYNYTFLFFCFWNNFLRVSPCSEELVRSSGKFLFKQSSWNKVTRDIFPEIAKGGQISYKGGGEWWLAQSYAVLFSRMMNILIQKLKFYLHPEL